MSAAGSPRDEDAIDYALGVGNAAERRAFEREMANDAALASVVRGWDELLVALSDAVPSVQPRSELFAAVESGLGGETDGNVLAFRGRTELDRLRRSRSVWRSATALAASLAAALAIFIAVERGLGEGPGRTLVAVVNRAGDLPALIVRVDPRAGILTVRSLATDAPADRSLELWSIAAGQTPRSLGVVTGEATTLRVTDGAAQLQGGVILAVTLEPKGGSPTGTPSGPPVYSGKLVTETP